MIQFPATYVFPKDAKIACPKGRWRRLRDGRIEVTFLSSQEMAVCFWFDHETDGNSELVRQFIAGHGGQKL